MTLDLRVLKVRIMWHRGPKWACVYWQTKERYIAFGWHSWEGWEVWRGRFDDPLP